MYRDASKRTCAHATFPQGYRWRAPLQSSSLYRAGFFLSCLCPALCCRIVVNACTGKKHEHSVNHVQSVHVLQTEFLVGKHNGAAHTKQEHERHLVVRTTRSYSCRWLQHTIRNASCAFSNSHVFMVHVHSARLQLYR